jgi:uncharacterized membrane protein YidH (DUF202 family)
MGWVRTATSLISFGFTIYKFFQYLVESREVVYAGRIGPRAFAMLMILVGLTGSCWQQSDIIGACRSSGWSTAKSFRIHSPRW